MTIRDDTIENVKRQFFSGHFSLLQNKEVYRNQKLVKHLRKEITFCGK